MKEIQFIADARGQWMELGLEAIDMQHAPIRPIQQFEEPRHTGLQFIYQGLVVIHRFSTYNVCAIAHYLTLIR